MRCCEPRQVGDDVAEVREGLHGHAAAAAGVLAVVPGMHVRGGGVPQPHDDRQRLPEGGHEEAGADALAQCQAQVRRGLLQQRRALREDVGCRTAL